MTRIQNAKKIKEKLFRFLLKCALGYTFGDLVASKSNSYLWCEPFDTPLWMHSCETHFVKSNGKIR
jgi:hypothetical protein